MKKTVIVAVVTSLAAGSVIHGCAQKKIETELDQKVSHESSIEDITDLNANTVTVITESPDLTDRQKMELTDLHHVAHKKLDDLYRQSLQLRSVLVKDVINPYQNEEEIELIKERLEALEKERLNLVFDTIERSNHILNRQSGVSERAMSEPIGNARFR